MNVKLYQFIAASIFLACFLCLNIPLQAQISISPDTVEICPGDEVTFEATIGVGSGVGTSSYTFQDIPYTPEDFTIGTPVVMADDQVLGPFPIGFEFCFFNNAYTQFYIGSNGWISFSPGQPTAFTSAPIPSAAANVPKNCIAFPWQDWHPGTGTGSPYVRYRTEGVAPNRRLIVSFFQVPLFSCTTTLGTFQAVLYETTNIVDNFIQSKPGTCTWAGGTATQGVHNIDGTVAYTVPGRNSTVWSATNEGTRFVPNGVQWLTATGGFITDGNTLTVTPPGPTQYIVEAELCDGTVYRDTAHVILLPPTPPTLDLTETEFCVDGGTYTLAGGMPDDGLGTYSGPGVTAGVFNPATAGVGTHTITFSYPNCGATGTATQDIVVHPPPAVNITAFPANVANICINADPYTFVEGNPAGGVYSGPGVTAGVFDPAAAGTGFKTITYTYTDANGCTNSATRNLVVRPLPNPSLADFADVCIDAAPFTLTGGLPNPTASTTGVYSGPGVTAGVFDPAAAGVGTHDITYTFTTNFGCSASATKPITVNPLPIMDFPPLTDVCIDNAVIDLEGLATPTGGAFSGTGVAANEFDPATAGAGTHTITYDYTDANGCENSITQDITVNPLPIVTCDPVPEICVGAAAFELTFGNPIGGTYSGTGVVGGTDFDALIAGAGDHTILYTFTDANGCTDTCSTVLTVADDENPTIDCPADIIVGTDLNACEATVTIPVPTTDDNCEVVSVVNDFNGTADASDVYPIGTTTVEYTVTDIAGNTASCSFTVTVEDDQAPNAICQPFTIVLDADGNGSITTADINNGSNDNCTADDDLVLSLSQTTFDCGDVGANTVTLTVTDAAGNSSSCDATVTVEDNTAPNALCQDITVQLDDTGNVSITPADIDDGSNDACGIAGLALDITDFDCSNVGANTVTLTVEDNNGNTSTCPATVTVEDNELPVLTAMTDFTRDTDVGECTFTNGDIPDGTATDNCGIDFYTYELTGATTATVSSLAGVVFNSGVTTVTWIATDVNGNPSASDVFTVTVEDNEDPNAICQPFTLVLDADGNGSITPADINNGSNDNCTAAGDLILSLSKTDFDCGDVGTNTITLTVTDAAGNSSSCDATVTVEDNTAPNAICQSITVQLDATGNVSITPAGIDNGSNDACGIASLSLDITDFDCSNVGANTVTLTVEDNNFNTSTCTATVTVEDNIAPNALCVAPFDVFLDPVTGTASITVADIDAGSNDACGIASMTISQEDFDCSDTGPQTITLTVIDNNTNVSTCDVTINVLETEAPVANCVPGFTLALDADGLASLTAMDIDDGSTDNCGIVSYSISQENFDCSDIGENNITLTVADASGNISTCTTTVTIEDNTDPNALCRNITVQLDATGNVSITPADIDDGSNDACGIASLALDITDFDCSNVGVNMVTLTVEDNNGNTSTCTATVTVQDIELPVLTAMADFTRDTDALVCTFTNGDIADGTATDNCGIDFYTYELTGATTATVGSLAGVVFNSGVTTVTWTATDVNGNVSLADEFTVTVEDNEDPNAVCQDFILVLDATGNGILNIANINDGSNDNCTDNDDLLLSLSKTDFDCGDVGANTVTLTVEDEAGNTNSCTATVTVQDNTLPNALCQNITIQLDDTGNVSITPADIDDGSNDACGIASLDLDITDFDCSNVGANTVTLTVEDNNGNTSTCTATVTVQDNEIPVLTAMADFTRDTDALVCTFTNGDIPDGTATDNCGIDFYTYELTGATTATVGSLAGVVFNSGITTVTWTATDVNGNLSVADVFTVTVEDNEDPIAICQGFPLVLDADGNGSITPADINNGSNDNCTADGDLILSLSQTTFDCGDVGANTVTLTVTDAAGNSSSCDATVTVLDNTDPIAICQNITVQLDATGNVSITPADIDNGSNDACGIASLALDITDFDCDDVGANTVTLTVTDNNGNPSTCTATVTVQDLLPPTAICQNLTISLDPITGTASVLPTDVNDNSIDNCAISDFALSQTDFDCNDVGANTVTLTVIDAGGNTSTCNAVITVLDDTPPTAECVAPFDITLNASGTASISVADIDNGSSDNCDFTMALDRTDFDCADAGLTIPITLTATDASGNTDACVTNVTVIDDIAPTISCPANINVGITNNIGVCGKVVNYDLPTFDDNCADATLT
ncbi:MAG: HYR domain-containing protein, partial [Bernardetiaceae bacterium]|nr:HYR domain-containing protein [Bernardetiaceae bacterium]